MEIQLMRLVLPFTLLFIVGFCFGCGGGSKGDSAADGAISFELTSATNEDFELTFAEARSLGLKFASLSVPWDEIERTPGVFTSGVLGDANAFYQLKEIPVLLTIPTIDTNALRLPADLQGEQFSSPNVKARFAALLRFVLNELRDTTLVGISIGNEVDGLLGYDPNKWAEYLDFFESGLGVIHAQRKGTPVGAVLGFRGFLSSRAAPLIAASDVALVTYYPLNDDFSVRPVTDVSGDFESMVSAAQGKSLIVAECGYPSASENGSSEAQQRDFFTEMLRVWDLYKSEIPYLLIFSLTDYPSTFVAELGQYYRLQDGGFLAYLGSLGLRRADGSAKASFEVLRMYSASHSSGN